MLFSTRLPHSFWNPWADLEEARTRISSWMSDDAVGLGAPPLEAWMNEDALLVRALVPGAKSEDVEITVEGDVLSLTLPARAETEAADVRWHRRERSTAASARTLRLPFAVDSNGVRARISNGVLQIELPRAEHDKPRRVVVDTH